MNFPWLLLNNFLPYCFVSPIYRTTTTDSFAHNISNAPILRLHSSTPTTKTCHNISVTSLLFFGYKKQGPSTIMTMTMTIHYTYISYSRHDHTLARIISMHNTINVPTTTFSLENCTSFPAFSILLLSFLSYNGLFSSKKILLPPPLLQLY